MGYMPFTPRTRAGTPLKRKPLVHEFKENIVDEAILNDIDELAPETEVCAAANQSTTESSTAEKCSVVYVCCHSQPELCKKRFVETSTQTQDLVVLDHAYSYLKSTRSTGTQHTTTEFNVGTISNDSDARFYTGLTLSVLLSLVSALTPFANKLQYKLNVGDQILAVLIRLRLGLSFKDIARRFGVSTPLASKMFKSWMTIMADNLSDCVCWLPRETIRRTLPGSFDETYPRTTCIIDCSEIFIPRPFSLKARAQTWSTYKSHNTAKFLVAIAPNGFIMFISPLYGGRASDNFITKSSGFLNYLLPGDEVMADRGFTIGEELCARRVKLNIPAFMKGRSQLSEQETIDSRRIASVRIHVERAIMRMKSYRLLNTTLQIKSLKSHNLDKVFRVVACLCNMHDSLIRQPDDCEQA
ncbi:uncharacterized protein LOC127840648 [Dreissena polymorpha]|uniref:uncharacterized protein LOC127840648 n=1 Tax=Dreissena polymorpha TaxID=45954 RepID=UPI0022656ED9|nr:uncharacterized protein LOC127840648 [Dreissena polymorpha]